MSEMDAYNEALSTGQYEKPAGLLGKYDNVRRFWEDEELALYLWPFLKRLLEQRRKRGEKVRMLDLGCGSGDGFELITSIKSSESLSSQHNTAAMDSDMLGFYTGIDLNEGLLRQAQAIYGNRQNMVFVREDFNKFDLSAEEPYDLYLASYGTLSHNDDEQSIQLLSNIARHSKDGAIIVIDWLGRYSYEWQTLWTNDFEQKQWMDYAISYIYQDGEASQQELSYFPLRIMGRKEVLSIYRQAKKKSGGCIVLRKLADRSSFVGRHMDTAQYNEHCQPLRCVVNRLFEPNVSTDLDEVLIHYVPRSGFPEVNTYHQRLSYCWNYLITYTKALLDEGEPAPTPAETPLPLKQSLGAMRKIATVAERMKIGTPRTSLVEPQLGYCLRELEMRLQQGQGCGHGLVAIFEVVK